MNSENEHLMPETASIVSVWFYKPRSQGLLRLFYNFFICREKWPWKNRM